MRVSYSSPAAITVVLIVYFCILVVGGSVFFSLFSKNIYTILPTVLPTTWEGGGGVFESVGNELGSTKMRTRGA